MLFEIEFMFLSELEIIDILEKAFNMFVFEFGFHVLEKI